ncbi:Cyclin-L2 [Drechslerella dactyloides]|uniref:RNA polymerase II holoenzyme cyclin-like subunit n=1 Tax=Drechslerella dactyloides TaxID=74499 RepID=A0AAD6NGM6_DREDA|nr:Cyclin-L2 [Drechslerella dactyloides]
MTAPAQLATTPSQLAGIPEPLEQKLRLVAARLLQAAGILLELYDTPFPPSWTASSPIQSVTDEFHSPQPTIATAVVLLQRFYLVTAISASPLLPTCLAALFLACKLTERPQKPRDLVNVFKYLLSPASPLHPPHLRPPADASKPSNKDLYYVSEGDYTALRSLLLQTEAQILRAIGFDTTVHLPYTLAFNYLQSLNVLTHKTPTAPPPSDEALFNPLQNDKLVATTFAYLTDMLSSPSQPYLTHHPHELAVAGIYMAARDHSVKLPDRWWEVWDVERETLGFLLVVGRGGTYIGSGGKVWVVEEGSFEEQQGGEVVAISKDSVAREALRLLAE